MNSKKVLVVDDDAVTRDLLREVLEGEGYELLLAPSGEEALNYLGARPFLVLSDIRMLEMDGLALLSRVRKSSPDTLVVLMTGFGSMDGAVRAIQEGAYDYISKPFRMNELKALVAKAHKQWTLLAAEGRAMQAGEPMRPEKRTLLGTSGAIVEVYKCLAKASLSSSSILIFGERGTGKELVARSVHDNSSRRDKGFFSWTCGTLTESLLEEEVFSESAGGTLFLDEVSELSIALQARLVRILEEGSFKGAGPGGSLPRLIAATRRKLSELVEVGSFRADLYYRLNVIEINLPPLRERMEDLPALVSHFVAMYSDAKIVSHVSPPAMELLSRHSWPGNVRELENSIERAVAMSNGPVLFPEDFVGLHSTKESLPAASLEQMEKDHILRVLQETQYNKSKASSVLGIDRATLYRKAQRYGIELKGAEGRI